MNWLKVSWIIIAVFLGCVGIVNADATTSSSPSWLNRDQAYEQDLKYMAGPDTTITPAKVLRLMSSMFGHPMFNTPSNTEFEPVVYVHNTEKQFVARIAYKF